MVGSPGSGKSHFSRTYLNSYYYINRDTLGSWQKCASKTNEMLTIGKSVVIDNTNPDQISRQRYIEIAKKHDVPVRCFVMDIHKEHVKHNNMVS
jgi:bifunctional polynucleotide phosphatase/kinase